MGLCIAGDWMKPKKVAIIVVAIWLSCLILIQIIAIFTVLESMPDNCTEDSRNCSRLAHDGTSHRNGDLQPLFLNASIEEVSEFFEDWFENRWFSSSSTTIEGNTTLIHGVDRTEFWLFPDDVHIALTCVQDKVEVTIHSQSRLGLDDLGENQRRLTELHADAKSSNWQESGCAA